MEITLHRPRGSLARGPYALALTPEEAGWAYSGLRVLELEAGQARDLGTGGDELLVLPLAGACVVECDGERFELAGRPDVFSAVTDFAYLPRDAAARISSEAGGRFALPAARADRRLAARYVPAAEVPVELRGAGSCSRQVNNFCTPEAFEAPQGYAYAFYGDDFFPEDLLNFGPPFRVVDPGFVVKLFPSQFATQFVITAGRELHGKIPDAGAIRAVRLKAPRMPYINRPRPQTGLDGKFSVQYTFAAALLHGEVRIDSFTDQAVHAPDIIALLGKVAVDMVADIPARFDKMHVEAEVELADGRVLRARCDGPRGMWGTTPLTDEEHLVKVRDCLSKRLGSEKMERCIALARGIDTLGPDEVVELLAIAGCFP